MLDKKGQALIAFVILLPLLLGICAYVIDVGIITYESNKLKNIIEENKNELNNIDKNLKINNIKKYQLKRYNNCIKVTYYKESIFGSIIGIKKYKISEKGCKN